MTQPASFSQSTIRLLYWLIPATIIETIAYNFVSNGYEIDIAAMLDGTTGTTEWLLRSGVMILGTFLTNIVCATWLWRRAKVDDNNHALWCLAGAVLYVFAVIFYFGFRAAKLNND